MKIQKSFISEMDQFLEAFDAANPLSDSQKVEINKHRPVHASRDHARTSTVSDSHPNLWEKF